MLDHMKTSGNHTKIEEKNRVNLIDKTNGDPFESHINNKTDE